MTRHLHVWFGDAGEFKEGDHPRATNGQFGAGGGTAQLGTERLDSKGHPDPAGEFVSTPLQLAKGRELREVASHIYAPVAKAYGQLVSIRAKDIQTFQKTVSLAKVRQYEAHPETEPAIAAGRVSGALLAFKYKGTTVLVDGNHRVSAAALKDEKVELMLVDMDEAMAEATQIRKPGEGLGYALMQAAKKVLSK